MSRLRGHLLRDRSLLRLALADLVAVGNSVDKDDVLGESNLSAVLVGSSVDDLSASSVGPGLSASSLVLLAGLLRTHLDLLAEGSVRLALEVDDALVVLALLKNGGALDLGYILGLGGRDAALLGRPVADIIVADGATAVAIDVMLETH